MNKRFWIAAGVIAAVFIGIMWAGGGKDSTGVGANTSGVQTTHITGNRNASVKLVEYSDFQCPACGAYFPLVEQVVAKYKDSISFEYRHYPLTTIHQNAFAAARASEAADSQGKFWDMYRLLFVNQSAWESSRNAQSIFEGYAKQLGLDAAQFKTDYASSKTNSAINADVAGFNQLGLTQSTPTFLLNGKKIQPANLEEFNRLIDEQLAR